MVLLFPFLSSAQSPIITADATVCANSTLQLQSKQALSYQWSPATGLSDATVQNPVFAAGSASASTTYTLNSVSLGNNLIVNGDFEQGNTGFYTNYIYCNTGNCLFPLANNGYSVQSNPTFVHIYFTGADHTTGSGQFMMVNGGIPSYIAWQESVTVKPNTNYVFAAWICTVSPQSPAVLNFTINGVSTSNNFVAPPVTNQWVQYYITWNSGSSTSAVISLNDLNPASSGNDFGLDDIFFGEPVLSTGTVTLTTAESTSSVNIAATATTICNGQNVTFTATPTNGGATPVYQWLVNGANAGTNSPTFSSTTLANGDVVSCSMTGNAPCVTTPVVTSNNITMTVNPNLKPSVTISTPSTDVCVGSPVAFTASVADAGASPGYQWQLNGSNAGTNSPNFSSTFNNGDVISCVLTIHAPCSASPTVTSNSITLNVVAPFTPSVSISASGNKICAGTAVTFTATPGNGIPTPAYQWQVNGTAAGTNSANFTSTTLNDGDVVSCILSTISPCASVPSATSNSIAMVVYPNLKPSVSITASLDNICSTTQVTFTATPVDPGKAPIYQWLLNGANVGTNSTTYINSNLANGDKVSCTLTVNDPCTVPVVSTSNTIPIRVTLLVTPSVNIAAAANGFCAGSPATFTATPVNGGGQPVFQWMVNGANAGDNSPTFVSTTLNDGDVITCNVTNNAPCAFFLLSKSNSITVKINPLPVVDAGPDKTIDKGRSATLSATASGNITDITWSPSGGLDNNKILTPKASPAISTLYTVTVQNNNGCMAIDSVFITVRDGVEIPNAFTPNGDGVNDLWQITNLKDYQNCSVKIFDRYGQEVFSSTGYYSAWDGTSKGKRLPFGTYYYVITLGNGTGPISGYVAIIK